MRATQLGDLLGAEEPHATWHHADLLSVEIDYVQRQLVSVWDLLVGDATSNNPSEGERVRRGRLVLTGLLFWATEGPTDPQKCDRPPCGCRWLDPRVADGRG
jgi:hypothetical protein